MIEFALRIRKKDERPAVAVGVDDVADACPTIVIRRILDPKDGTVKWIKNPPNDNGWTRVCDIVDAYRNGRTLIFFTNSKGELDHYLDGVCPRRTPSL